MPCLDRHIAIASGHHGGQDMKAKLIKLKQADLSGTSLLPNLVGKTIGCLVFHNALSLNTLA